MKCSGISHGDYDERRGYIVSQILKGMHCSYSLNLNLMVVKLVGEMNGHAVT